MAKKGKVPGIVVKYSKGDTYTSPTTLLAEFFTGKGKPGGRNFLTDARIVDAVMENKNHGGYSDNYKIGEILFEYAPRTRVGLIRTYFPVQGYFSNMGLADILELEALLKLKEKFPEMEYLSDVGMVMDDRKEQQRKRGIENINHYRFDDAIKLIRKKIQINNKKFAKDRAGKPQKRQEKRAKNSRRDSSRRRP